jgi:eukaryotic-like serine/threonine-protein kinase
VKACSACFRLFPEEGGFCPIDGQKLLPIAEISPKPDPDDKRVGAKVCGGRYQIWRRVADGGMGRVYQALDLVEGRTVALKILHADVAEDPVSLQRFKREFECSASLPHDHIVEVLAFEKTEDQSFALVMEYLEGEELRMLLKREKVLSPERVIRMLAQVAVGLSAAHDRKVVHRDLKPDNIFLCGKHDGDLSKILDFGSVRDNSEGAKKLTVMGTTIGSPFYMSPEQAQALPSLDHRADVWSLAAIAYECLTGKVPFSGPTGPSILLAILTNEPGPPSEVGKAHGVPKTLDPVIEEALTKEPNIRIASIGLLADRVGQAYGLEGSHADWAKMPQDDVARQIKERLPMALAKHEADAARAPDVAALDAAFKVASEDPFMAGSAGGPVNGSTFGDDDVVMGMPKTMPRWLVPVVAGAAVVVGVVIAFMLAR